MQMSFYKVALVGEFTPDLRFCRHIPSWPRITRASWRVKASAGEARAIWRDNREWIPDIELPRRSLASVEYCLSKKTSHMLTQTKRAVTPEISKHRAKGSRGDGGVISDAGGSLVSLCSALLTPCPPGSPQSDGAPLRSAGVPDRRAAGPGFSKSKYSALALTLRF
ncbi:hypothetical protein SRHO_G00044230 [Serrasalmus rhombeus]